MLSDAEYTLQNIEERYAEYKKKNTGEPSFAQCEIAHCESVVDSINETELMILKLNPEVIEEEDDNIFFNCQNYEELKTLIRPGKGRDFVVNRLSGNLLKNSICHTKAKKFKISGTKYDRRVKLDDEDREEIKRKFKENPNLRAFRQRIQRRQANH